MKNNTKRLFSILSLLILIVITTVKCKKDAEEIVPVVDEPKPTAGFDGTQRCTFELATPQVVGAYTLTSGNDAEDRDPRYWILQGSIDGIQYTDLHTVTTCPWANPGERRVTKRYYFDNFVAYKFYRLYIKANRGSRVFQLSEWTINKKQP